MYGVMFSPGCIRAALSDDPTLDMILQGGLSVIHQASQLAAEVAGGYAQDKAWEPIRYGHLPFSGDLNNMTFAMLALLYGRRSCPVHQR